MAQHLFNSDSPSPGSDKAILDANFTDLYSITQLLQSTATALAVGKTPSAWAAGGAGSGIDLSGSNISGGLGVSLGSNCYYNAGWKYSVTGAATRYDQVTGAYHAWFNAVSGSAGVAVTFNQVMTLDASGNLLLGATALGSVNANAVMLNAPGGLVYSAHASGTATGAAYFGCLYNGTAIGSITQNGTTGVAYNTSSDYRLKDNVTPMTGSGAFIDALKPCTWTWKVDGSVGAGFIAHELQAVSPMSVTGSKDAVDTNGHPIYQAVEYGSSEVIAMLVAEVKSLRARLATAGIA